MIVMYVTCICSCCIETEGPLNVTDIYHIISFISYFIRHNTMSNITVQSRKKIYFSWLDRQATASHLGLCLPIKLSL